MFLSIITAATGIAVQMFLYSLLGISAIFRYLIKKVFSVLKIREKGRTAI